MCGMHFHLVAELLVPSRDVSHVGLFLLWMFYFSLLSLSGGVGHLVACIRPVVELAGVAFSTLGLFVLRRG